MKKDANILVALSGGVDSATVAYLVKQQGYNPVGITMSVWDGSTGTGTEAHACYGPDEKQDIEDIKHICKFLDIPLHIFDCSREYRDIVLSYFRDEYISGNTPNPCIVCNKRLKLGILPELASREGISYHKIATGHYAQIAYDSHRDRYNLKKALDPQKDQSYFLYRLSQEQLSQLWFPLGAYTKTEVQSIAQKAGLPVSDKPESQDFYSGDYTELLDVDNQKGDIVLENGTILGTHKGIWNYTIGQRRGLGVAYHEPLYVKRLNPATNTVVVGPKEEVLDKTFDVYDIHWTSGFIPEAALRINVKVRSSGWEHEAMLMPRDKDQAHIWLIQGKETPSPGQSAVFYHENQIIGGGIIKREAG